MADPRPDPDVRAQIDNALAILGAQLDEPHVLRRNLAMCVATLRAARRALDDLEAQLDLLTAPERDAAREVGRLTEELEAARGRSVELEQALRMLRQEHEIEGQLAEEDRRRLAKLERKAKDFDAVLMEDDDAFSRFMEQKLDEQDRPGQGTRKGPRPPQQQPRRGR